MPESCDLLVSTFASALGEVLSRSCGQKINVAIVEAARPSKEKTLQFQVLRRGGTTWKLFFEVRGPELATYVEGIHRPDSTKASDEYGRILCAWIKEACVVTWFNRPERKGDDIDVHASSNVMVDGMASTSLSATNERGDALTLTIYFDSGFEDTFRHGSECGGERNKSESDPRNLDLVMNVDLNVLLRFGQREMSLREVLELQSGSVIELDRRVDEPVELLLDGKILARGEAVIIDGNYGLRVTEVLQGSMSLNAQVAKDI